MKILVGCVADNTSKYLEQALRLLLSWRWFANSLSNCDFFVCAVESVPNMMRKRFERHGARVILVKRFSDSNPQSNKLRFLELDNLSVADRVILLDCDTLVVQEPCALLSSYDLAAKISDGPTVGIETFKNLFSYFKIPMPKVDKQCTVRGEATIPYFNSGVLSFSKHAIKSLVPEWIDITRKLTQKFDLLGKCSNFCEQASLSLAIAKVGTSIDILNNEMNFPAHYPSEELPQEFINTDPVIIHYHWLVEKNGLIKTTPYPNVNSRIIKFNTKFKEEKNEF